MVVTRWGRPVAAGVVAVGLVVGLAATTVGARDRPWDPPPCDGPLAWTAAAPGTWWRLDPLLTDGELSAQRLVVGLPGSRRSRWLRLPAESFAAGPFDGRVLVGSDDGRRSTLRLLDPAADCARTVATTDDVVRRATVTPDRRAMLEFRVARGTRRDLGVYRRPFDAGGGALRVVGPIAPDARFGPTWSTEFTWSLDGRQVAIQSCGAVACRTRVMDPFGRASWSVADPDQGDLIGLAADRLVLYASCTGLPCPILAVDRSGRSATLVSDAGAARVGADPEGRAVVVHEGPDVADPLEVVTLDGATRWTLPTRTTRSQRLVPGPSRAGGAAETEPGELVLAPEGRLPLVAGTPLTRSRVPHAPRPIADDASPVREAIR